MKVSAPGKLMLAGEYAVLRGGTAIVAAVDRRAIARVLPEAERDPARALSPFLAAAAQVLEDRTDAGAAASLLRAGVVVDTSALADGGVKLGLGSSAASTVAAIGCALVATGQPLRRDLVHMLARDAHRLAQGARGVPGSGADVAASTFGGVLWLRDGVHGALPLPPARWLALWTGRAADTVSLVQAVDAARGNRPGEIDAATDAIAAAAQGMMDATDAAGLITAVEAGGEAIARLGAAAGLDLETEAVRAARLVAARAGGAVKTCGAGGGDVAIAVFPDGVDPAALASAFLEAGCRPLDLAFDPRGVDTDAAGDYLP